MIGVGRSAVPLLFSVILSYGCGLPDINPRRTSLLRIIGNEVLWEQCTPLCAATTCCVIHMISRDDFTEECLKDFECQTLANDSDTICACPHETTGGSISMKNAFENWLKNQNSTTTPAPASTTQTTSTTTEFHSTLPPVTVSPAPLPSRSVFLCLGSGTLALLLAGAVATIVLIRTRRRLRRREMRVPLLNEQL